MEILRSLRRFQFLVSSKLLFAWIKPTILGCDRGALGLDDGDIVFYVLPHRSIADLLVTNRACELNDLPPATAAVPAVKETRAFFFLGHPEGTWGRKTQRRQSSRMARLFAHQANRRPGEKPIKIVPASLFWGHQPDREKSIFKLLLSENWSVTSSVKKLLAMLFHPGHILVQFGAPVNLTELMASEQERPRQIRKLMRLLRVHFNRQKQAIIGPDLSHRRTLLNTILTSPEVRDAIEREARHQDLIRAVVEKKALGYAREIASDQSYRVVRFFDLLLSWLWNNLYDGIEVNGVGKAKVLAQSHEIVFTPCHRSHIDYLLLSYVLYHNGLTPPHIASGKNLNLPVIGSLLRHAGAFFMRRSFQGDALYKVVFDEYLHQMFTKGYSVEYFIEGGRSRTGRTLTPRTGMLSMTVRSFQRDSTRPIAFLPVYFGYARVLEAATYMAELEGKNKKKESIFDLFKIFSSFKHSFGEVTVNFGEPLLLRSFLDEHLECWEQPEKTDASEFSRCCVALSRTLATNINAAVAIKPTNLVALALVSTTHLVLEEGHLKQQIRLLMQIAVDCGHKGYSLTSLAPEKTIEEAISIFGLGRHGHQSDNLISASPRNLLSLTYNANNVIHIYILPSLVARYIQVNNAADVSDLTDFCLSLFPFLRAEMFLPFDETAVESEVLKVITCLTESGIITRQRDALTAAPVPDSSEGSLLSAADGSLSSTADGSLFSAADGSLSSTADGSLSSAADGSLFSAADGSLSSTAGSLRELARISEPTLARYYIIIALLLSDAEPSSRRLEKAASDIAEQLSAQYGNKSSEFFDRSLFASFLLTLKQQTLITSKDARLSQGPGFDKLGENTAATLPADLRDKVLRAVMNYEW